MALADGRFDSIDIKKEKRRSIILLQDHPLSTYQEDDATDYTPDDTPRNGTPTIAIQDFSVPLHDLKPPPRAARPQFKRIESFQRSYQEQAYSPEGIILEQAASDPTRRPRPRSDSHHLSSVKVPSRTWLLWQARFWRAMMGFAMNYIPKVKAPRRLHPMFTKTIRTSMKHQGHVTLHFWVPPGYMQGRAHGKRFPVVVDFHGGGFCLGAATDDRHWARVATRSLDAVVVGVDYRLAPEHPFPGPVDDCIDALLYLTANAAEFSLDMSKTVLSGFSAGANLAFTVPLRLEHFTKMHDQMLSVPSQASNLERWPSTAKLLNACNLDDLHITNIIAFYPLLDWTSSRASKRRNSRNPKHTLPKIFTDLFDYSYLPPPDIHGYHCSPYASPALAPDYMLRDGIPENIQLWLCGWDMLLAEGERFAERLKSLGKNVQDPVIPEVPHAFDQSANPMRDQEMIDGLYSIACERVKKDWAEAESKPQ